MSKRENAALQLRSIIETLLGEHRQKTQTLKQIVAALGLENRDKSILKEELDRMQAEGLVVKTTQNRYGLPERLHLLTGVLEGNRRGFAFLRPDRSGEDVFIGAGSLSDASHGDRVLVRLDQKKKSRRNREGTVIGILKRGKNRLVGTLYRERKNAYVVPDDRRFPVPVKVPHRDLGGAQNGDKVIVEIQTWAQGSKPARGVLVERFGPAGAAHTEQLAFRHKYDLPGEFPAPVLKELDGLPPEEGIARLAEEQGRVDLRDLKMVTIDDRTARDFDDAVSLERPSDSVYRLGVHIADVSQYVREGRPLNREALKRGTSTYLVEKVIHMLPPRLSENLCSLQAGRDRLAMSVIMDLDPEGELVDARFFPSLIRVAERLTYQQVEAYLSGENGRTLFNDASLPEMLDRMSGLAGILRRRRLKRGALDLDLPEARIEIDEEGVPTAVEKRAMGQAEALIEEFMIYCNETVAGYLSAKKLPCIYRVHALPTEEKLALLRETLSLMGIGALSGVRVLKPKHLPGLLEKTRGEKAEKLVRYLVLRSLPQAMYSAANEGHFGLASECYCHFTSPIRRYPDLVVHRILKQQLAGGFSAERLKRLRSRLPEIALRSSERERAAEEAERASVEMKKAQYMEQRLGEIYTGIINGVTNFGIFVELDNTIEGMIPLTELKEDYYVYNERAASLVGERTRRTYRLGDSIRIRVIRASREEGRVTFAPAQSE